MFFKLTQQIVFTVFIISIIITLYVLKCSTFQRDIFCQDAPLYWETLQVVSDLTVEKHYLKPKF